VDLLNALIIISYLNRIFQVKYKLLINLKLSQKNFLNY
jgi:hypothetical protein